MKYPTYRVISKHLYFENPMMGEPMPTCLEEEPVPGEDDDSYIVGGTPASPGTIYNNKIAGFLFISSMTIKSRLSDNNLKKISNGTQMNIIVWYRLL
jgi:hypothetical protein